MVWVAGWVAGWLGGWLGGWVALMLAIALSCFAGVVCVVAVAAAPTVLIQIPPYEF